MSIVIEQGGRSWTAELDNISELEKNIRRDTINAFRAAFKKTVQSAASWVLSQVTPTIAKDTDLMRAGFDNAFEENTHIKLSDDIVEFEFEFNIERDKEFLPN